MMLTSLRSSGYLFAAMLLFQLVFCLRATAVSVPRRQTNDTVTNAYNADDVTKSVTRQKTFGTCQCFGDRSFETRFDRAYTVVKAQVISEWTSCKLCRGWNDHPFKIHVYVVRIIHQMKGPRMSEYSRVQGFSNVDMCGRRLMNGEYYLLMLPDPSRTSATSFWINPRKWPQVSQCEVDRYSDLSIEQVRFITTKRWLWSHYS